MTEIFNNILNHYTWQGMALMGVVLILFFVQLHYYGIVYNRIHNFLLMRRRKKVLDNPPISVIVPVRGENEHFLTEELPALMHQQYDIYEVVVVYIGRDTDYLDELQRLRDNYSNMRITHLRGSDHFYISTKQALNVGIKSAQYESMLFTTTGAMPLTNLWLATMAKGFERGWAVAGPALPHFERDNTRSFIMRLVEFHRNRCAMTRAIDGHLYYAPRSNFGFTQRLYDATRGYNHLSIDIGENDLYMQEIATAKRTSVVLSRNAVVVEERPSRWSEWMEWMRYYDTTRRHYPTSAKRFISRELGSRTLFFLSAIAALVVLPLELKIAVALMIIIRYAVVVWSSRRTARKLGETNIAMRYWIYDLVGPLVEYIITLRKSHNTPRLWR